MPSDDLSDTIATAAARPARVKVQDIEVESRGLSDLVEADKHLARKAAARSPTAGLRFTKIVHPGTV